jgi:hypothetical protein
MYKRAILELLTSNDSATIDHFDNNTKQKQSTQLAAINKNPPFNI